MRKDNSTVPDGEKAEFDIAVSTKLNEKLVSKVKMVLAIVDKKQFRERYSGKK